MTSPTSSPREKASASSSNNKQLTLADLINPANHSKSSSIKINGGTITFREVPPGAYIGAERPQPVAFPKLPISSSASNKDEETTPAEKIPHIAKLRKYQPSTDPNCWTSVINFFNACFSSVTDSSHALSSASFSRKNK